MSAGDHQRRAATLRGRAPADLPVGGRDNVPPHSSPKHVQGRGWIAWQPRLRGQNAWRTGQVTAGMLLEAVTEGTLFAAKTRLRRDIWGPPGQTT